MVKSSQQPFFAVIIASVPFLFSTSYSLYTQVMQIFQFRKSFEQSKSLLVRLPPPNEKIRPKNVSHTPAITHPVVLLRKPKQNVFFSKNVPPKTHLCHQCLQQALNFSVIFLKFRLFSVREYEIALTLIIKLILLVKFQRDGNQSRMKHWWWM